jgi:hypothetical protein
MFEPCGTSCHWRAECNRTCGTPMQVEALPISVAKQAGSTPNSSLPSTSFRAALATSISGSVPEHLQSAYRAIPSESKLNTESGAKSDAPVASDANVHDGSSSTAGLNRANNRSASFNSGGQSSKSASKADAKATANPGSATVPAITLLIPPVPSPTNPQISAEVLSSAQPNFVDASSAPDRRLFAHQLTDALACGTAPPFPIPQLTATNVASSSGPYTAVNRIASRILLPEDFSTDPAPENSPGSASAVSLKAPDLLSTTSRDASSSAKFLRDVSTQTSNAQAILSTLFEPGTPATTANAPATVAPLTPALPTAEDSPILVSSALAPSSTRNPSLVLSTNSTFDISPPAAFVATSMAESASIPSLQSSVSHESAALSELASVKPAAVLKSTEPNVGRTPDNPIAGSTAQSGSTVAEPVPASGPAMSQANFVAAQTSDSPGTGFVISDSIATNAAANAALPVSNISNSISHSSTLASIVPLSNDAPSTSKVGVAAQPASVTASPATEVEKKSALTLQPGATSSAPTQSVIPPWHVVAIPAATVGNPSAAFAPPAPSASSAPLQPGSDPAPSLPQTHQMLDSAPPAPLPPAVLATDPATAAQMNAQMHVGLRTDALGAVEIHTVVQQSQIGITVHSDREISRWFTSEVPILESGLSHQHLNLVAVDFDSGRSGVQTASSFQHGQPRQHSSETHGSRSRALADRNSVPEPAIIDTFPADPFVGPRLTRVSIHA